MTFLIGEVEEITGVKAHVLRYWEEVIPSLAPKKNIGGQREYTPRDVQIISRLNFLINKKKFTIEGARNQIIAEQTGDISYMQNTGINNIDMSVINEVKTELLSLYKIVHKDK